MNLVLDPQQNEALDIMRDLREKEVLVLLKIGASTLKRWRASGRIKFHKSGDNTAPITYEVEEVERVRLLMIDELKSEIDELCKSVYEYLQSESG